jgi:AraC family transcriptional regulator, regulatory protein of adaptative response / DNA-3-methyladenine glycosylase II
MQSQRLSYRPPFAWDELLAFLAQRALPGVEHISNGCYSRVLRMHDMSNNIEVVGWICIQHDQTHHRLVLNLSNELAPLSDQVIAVIRRVFDLDRDVEQIRLHLAGLADNHPALRLPGAFDGFELAVRAILGQQITVKAARTLAGRFVQRFGDAFAQSDVPELHTAFPTPAQIAMLEPSAIAELGIIRRRSEAIIGIAKALLTGKLSLASETDIDTTIAALCELPNIGPWTAHYITMRSLSYANAWPPRDVAILTSLNLPNNAAGQRQADAMAERWKPWRSYAVLHAWYCLSLK